MAEEIISHAEALRLIDERTGERVYFGVLVARADDLGDDPIPVEHVVGPLRNPLDPIPPWVSPDDAIYQVGGGSRFRLAPMTGTIHLRDNGVDFRVAETVTLRVAWRGSTEVGDWRPTAEGLARLHAVGIKLPEHEKPGVVLTSESADKMDA
jgi:hypothetical protein